MRKWNLGAAVILCLATLVGISKGAEPKRPMSITKIEGISEYRLENGLKILLFPDASKPTVTVNLTVFVGSRHEGYGEAGMAHLLEHMLFKGTPDHPQIPKLLQGRGAEYNGTTWVDRTNYFETLPANDENLEFAIRLEADRMINSYVKAEDLTSEMTVVRNEFERGENMPAYVLAQRMMGAAYEWHNYGKSTIGNRADIERVPVDNLKAFYKKYYQPDNAMVVVAGRFEEKKALELIGKYFGAIPKPERKLDQTYTEEPAQDGERHVTLRRVGDVAVVGVVYHIPAGSHPDFAAVEVLEAALTDSPSGRLYKALVEQKKAADLNGVAFAWHDPGVIRIMAEVANGNTPEAVLDTLLDTIDGVVDRGVTAEEIQRSKLRLLKQRELAASDSSEIAVELSEWAAQGDWRLYFLHRDRLESVTLEDVNRVARAYLQPTNRTVGIYIPTEQATRTSIPGNPDLAKLLKDYKGREDLAVGEEFDVAPLAIEKRTKRTEIGGVKVALLPKKTRGSTVVLRLTLRYGTEKSLFGMAKPADFLATMMTRGTKKLTRQQLQDQLDQNLATLGASGSAGEVTFAIQTKRDKLPAAIDLLRQVLLEPVFPADELEILKAQVRSDLEQNMTDPQSRAVKAVSRVLSPYPAGDVRYAPSIEEELKSLADLDIASIKKLYTDFLSAQAGQLVIVGDFDEAACMKPLTAILKDWKSKQPYERITRSGEVDYKPDFVTIEIPDKANAFYFSGSVVPMTDADDDYPALIIGNYVLGAGALSSRLGDRVRQKEGLSYGVGSMFRASAIDRRATMSLYAIYNPGNKDKVVKAIREEFELLLAKGITEQELNSARDGYLQRQQVARTEDPNLAQVLESTLVVGRTMEFHAKQEEKIRALTPAEVQSALKKYLSPDKQYTVVSGDFSGKKTDAGATEK